MKRTHIIFIIFSLLALISGVAQADVTNLPASDWYAVAMPEDGSLYWINAQGEQLLISRPEMEGEISVAQTRLHISPDGRYLLILAPLNTGREGIGLYNFESGQWVQTHQTQENEVVMHAGRYPFTETSSHFVLSLRNQITKQWRMIVFDTQANPVATLPMSSQMLPQSIQGATDWFPVVSFFNFDEGVNMLDVRFHMMSNNQDVPDVLTPFQWRIPQQGDQQSVSPDSYKYGRAGFDINPMTGRLVSAFNNPNVSAAPSSSAGNSIIIQNTPQEAVQFITSEGNTNLRLARWLKNGEWIGYWRENQVQQPHWMVMQANGQNAVPLGPNLTQVHHVSDGFLAVDTSTYALYHATDLNFEGFSSSVGNTIFQGNRPFRIIYTTPANTTFTLPSVTWQYSDGNAGQVELDVATACDATAPQPRLTVGETARITYTDGTPLNIRTAPAGDFIMQMPEGTTATVIEGPICEDGYHWWNLSFNNGTGGWAAEGDFDDYYLEPFTQLELAPPVIEPTPMVIAPPVIQPTTTGLTLNATVFCSNSPQKRLSTGQMAHSLPSLDGTLALRTNLSDPYPSQQVPAAQNMSIIAGPQCRDNITMWQVQLTLNGQSVTGWLAEGYGNNYYLAPGTTP